MVVLLIGLSAFPIENAFLRFDSLASSFSYSQLPNEKLLHTIVEKDCAFIISGENMSSTSISTSSKYGDKWGLIEPYPCQKTQATSTKNMDETVKTVMCSSTYNKNSNKYITVFSGFFKKNAKMNLSVKSESGSDYKLFYHSDDDNVSTREYYLIDEGKIPNSLCIYVDGKEIEFFN